METKYYNLRVVLLLVMLLCGFGVSSAQDAHDARPGGHGKRLQTKLATADRLRLFYGFRF